MSKIITVTFYVAFGIWALFSIDLALLIAGVAAMLIAIIIIAGN